MVEFGQDLGLDAERIGKVFHWAFSRKKQPLGDPEYEELRRLYEWNKGFHDQVDAAFHGMGMIMVEFHDTGIYWKEEKPGSSPTKPMVWDYTNDTKEMQAVEALIAFGVATTFYPRTEYLEESDEFAARPFTTDEIHQSILQMGAMAAEMDKGADDPSRNDVEARIVAAYKYLRDIPDASESDGKRGRRRLTVRDLIEKHLKIMKDNNRFFTVESQGWRPTIAYKNAVKLALDDPMVLELFNFRQTTNLETEQ
jgi:hypothetical protein